MIKTYKNKRVFVTGHTGFKGSWLITMLNHLGAEVMGYALAPHTVPSLYTVVNGDTHCNSVIADIRDKELLREKIIEFQPDFIFHLAAQPLVRESYLIPNETFEVNAVGTANVLDAIRELEKPCIGIMITTDKVYQNNETGQAYKETDPLGGYDPYSASKACAELIIDSYRKSFFHPQDYANHRKSIASARAGNVIGGGDWATDRLIPDIVRALAENHPVSIRNPKAVRPWQHVLEPLSGYLTLGVRMAQDPVKYAEAFNFGPHPADVLTVKEMADMALKIWGKGEVVFPAQNNQPHEAGLLSLDITKAETILEWHPKFDAKQALEHTLEWYKAYYEKENMICLLKTQIATYFQ
ncbi:CDP-glucose 4,6-dehydratase [Bacteroidales bacterium OttesenSCG-928-B11]|nr:CDP-glucose 4,6-dehydratase [Bacteroidales bacterium OttesenSCG-928-E04]MDL2312550.1 CDP-glucose 4,6-dehydratase [Bacteroidales bacterium OttesenSCG-928-B11]